MAGAKTRPLSDMDLEEKTTKATRFPGCSGPGRQGKRRFAEVAGSWWWGDEVDFQVPAGHAGDSDSWNSESPASNADLQATGYWKGLKPQEGRKWDREGMSSNEERGLRAEPQRINTELRSGWRRMS